MRSRDAEALGPQLMINMEDLEDLEDLEGRRRADSLTWTGLRNTYFWIDPKSGIGGAIFVQMLPFADPKVLALYDRVERTANAAIRT